ncbi:UDP-2,3-diacylglucosamine diphosphatase [Curvibacter sp. HBC28]|uniref:UDP-2,3-diacylglucosamine hydrolase n=1 Tax=Curvibacter microcysteis TaxID=3026419 RepID=A0ABT5ME81_9BURK|nr:UDP-2,3-diacylglucosamine diphosphatase [Curvibacter sp. HBC28]MDD0814731.1 UDP-2,3-diacylglucosamine diphosphatase [Curvibacter sp. HBC28]
MPSTVPQPVVLAAPTGWRTVDFISDLHLHPTEPQTFEAWQQFLLHTPADALFLLGDIFEVWVGDDAATPDSFEAQCQRVLQQAASLRPMFFMAGNRDFLLGSRFLAASGLHPLSDPTCLRSANGPAWLLSHGDALCLDDHDYLRFRAQVRRHDWQKSFLARPLAERQAFARQLRQDSEARKRSGATYADLDTDATRAWLQAAQAQTLIHGHTHRPRRHDLGDGLYREVLSDWDLAASPARAEVLRLDLATGQCQRLSPAQACASGPLKPT